RDLEALQVAGFPIYTERVDGKNLWSVLDTVKHTIPIPFSLPELMALYFSTGMMKVFQGTVFHDSLESLSRKVKTTLPPDSKQFVENLEQTLHLGIKPYKQYSRFKEIITHVESAAVNRKSIEMVYYSMGRKKETRRKVDPYRIWFFNGTFYLIGLCHVRHEVRIFALDRIKMLHQTTESFEIPEIHSRDDGSVVFEAELAETVELKSWILGWGADALVLEPESLREEIRAEAMAILDRYHAAPKEKPVST
ncbi:MAG: WYL domain-containing protein, partial [Deltaproteobacteria bacterium]